MLKALAKPMEELRDYELAVDKLYKKNKPIHVTGALDSGLVHMVESLGEKAKYKMIITFSEQKAKDMYEDLKFFSENVYYYPAKDFIFFNADIHGNHTLDQRLEAIEGIINEKELVVITTIDGLMDRLVPLDVIKNNILRIDYDTEIRLEVLEKKLVNMGYEKCELVQSHGQFSVRGGIVDIFPLGETDPFRIDFWDETVDSIKVFDVLSQRTIDNIEEILIYPATEYVLTDEQIEQGIEKINKSFETVYENLRKTMKTEEAHRIKSIISQFSEQINIMRNSVSVDSFMEFFYKKTVSLIEYFPEEETVFFIDEPSRVEEKAVTVGMEYKESMISRLEKGYILPEQANVFMSGESILGMLNVKRTVYMTALDQKIKCGEVKDKYSISMRNVNPYNNSFELLVKELLEYKKSGYRMMLVSGSRTRGRRLAETLFHDFGLNAFYSEDNDREIKIGEIMVTYGSIHKGFEYPMIKFAVISETDIFGSEKKKKKKKAKFSGEKIADFSDLNIGDYVVHENHGLGIYKGIEKIEVDKTVKDYIKIEYASNGNLYIPTTQFDMIQKYASSESRKPKLNKLGTKEWSQTKTRVKGAVKDIAAELVKLYAARQAKSGFEYGEDTVWQKEFEEMFPYDETDDQLNAIEDTKKDMESRKIMDRLVCGDVGYGKTEVAIRAAFKAVQDGKQVAFLVPTTILAQQHYNTFVQRMKDFPVNIELMSRFRTPSQQKKAMEGIQKGSVEIVIGTHRILSKDMKFKDLGLLIVDEEQRFGVAHKEKIKHLKENLDVLTLTATPIPRTLHMSLVGIRDMSVLEEPPVDRLPIQTYVMEYNDEMVREAINRELARGGQVYYVYNRVNNIDEITNQIKKLVPDANVVYAHGQMGEHKLEKIMYDFINGEIDVLVSTTIIETGLDISNANTMIIHDANKLGLSQLYQLRGRVGRSKRTSYAFMMYKRDTMLKEVAEKRLSAIREFTELGSGFKIAMRDLEIRGAGNILGAEQHGHMEAVGYDLYCKMLNEAVLVMKGERDEQEEYETSIDIKIDAYIPPSYIRNEVQKLTMYKKIALIETDEEYSDMEDELIDRFGDIPKAVQNLLKIALLKSLAHKSQVTDITGDKIKVKITMFNKAKIDINKIPDLVKKYRNEMKFVPDKEPYFEFSPQKPMKDMDAIYERMWEILNEIKEMSI